MTNPSKKNTWAQTKLGDICKITWGNTSITKSSYVSSGYPAYSASGADGFLNSFDYDETAIVLSAIGARCGKCFLTTGKWTAIKNTIVIRPLDSDIVNVDFLFHYINREEVWPHDGMAQPFITMSGAQSVNIPLPPLDEQKRIAKRLNEELSAVELARKAAEEQLHAAWELPSAYLSKMMNRKSNKWEKASLGEVCEITAPQVDPKIPEYGALPHVNGENIESGTCQLLYANTAAEDGMTSGKYLFEAGDVLYSKLRPYLRKVYVPDFRGVCSADMYPIKVNPEKLEPHYLAWLLVSDEFTKYADEESRRARMPKLNREQLFAWETYLPPVDEQKEILGFLNQKIFETKELQHALESQLEEINALPSALLGRAFGGGA